MSSKRSSLVVACGLIAVAVVGCQNADEIRHYQVPREPRMRMLAAIVPHGERTWFVRLTGPDQALERHKAGFRDFIKSLRFDDKGDPPLTWNTPPGWKQEKAAGGKGGFQRFATFRLSEPDGDDLEVTVFPLGREGQASSVLANVNRWRGQLGLSPVSAKELQGVTEIEQLKVGDTTATLVNLTGTGPRLVVARPPPTEAEAPVEAEGNAGPPTYDVPKGWKEAPLKQFSVATFQAGEGGKAEVTLTPFSGQAGGLLLNLQRWRNQVGLPEATPDELKKDMRTLDIGGKPAIYVEYIGPETDGQRKAIFSAVVFQNARRVWFFKMSGPAAVATGQRAAFEQFLGSVRFEGGKEGQP